MRYFKNIISMAFKYSLKSLDYTSFKKLFFRETRRSLSNSISSVMLDPVHVLSLCIYLLKHANSVFHWFTNKNSPRQGVGTVCQTDVVRITSSGFSERISSLM